MNMTHWTHLWIMYLFGMVISRANSYQRAVGKSMKIMALICSYRVNKCRALPRDKIKQQKLQIPQAVDFPSGENQPLQQIQNHDGESLWENHGHPLL